MNIEKLRKIKDTTGKKTKPQKNKRYEIKKGVSFCSLRIDGMVGVVVGLIANEYKNEKCRTLYNKIRNYTKEQIKSTTMPTNGRIKKKKIK